MFLCLCERSQLFRGIQNQTFVALQFPTTQEKILTTTESSYSGDQSGDDEDISPEEETEEPTFSNWTWLPTFKTELATEETTEETEMSTEYPPEEVY